MPLASVPLLGMEFLPAPLWMRSTSDAWHGDQDQISSAVTEGGIRTTSLADAETSPLPRLRGGHWHPLLRGGHWHLRDYRRRRRHHRHVMPTLQLLFAVIYYFAVVRSYTALARPAADGRAKDILAELPPCAIRHVSVANCFLSCYCEQARAAHTFAKAGACGYWPSCVGSFCCLPCMLFALHQKLRRALGAGRQSPVTACFFAFCCTCCVVAQQAEALDAATGQRCSCCGSGIGEFVEPAEQEPTETEALVPVAEHMR